MNVKSFCSKNWKKIVFFAVTFSEMFRLPWKKSSMVFFWGEQLDASQKTSVPSKLLPHIFPYKICHMFSGCKMSSTQKMPWNDLFLLGLKHFECKAFFLPSSRCPSQTLSNYPLKVLNFPMRQCPLPLKQKTPLQILSNCLSNEKSWPHSKNFIPLIPLSQP